MNDNDNDNDNQTNPILASLKMDKLSTKNFKAVTNILLADDDTDDCLLFKEALKSLNISTELTVMYNGEQVMDHLHKSAELPDILFLDLNMPRKNGFACLDEIKSDERLKSIPVITFSTSFEQSVVSLLYKNGAQYYIRKPNEFDKLKELILRALTLSSENRNTLTPDQDFVLK